MTLSPSAVPPGDQVRIASLDDLALKPEDILAIWKMAVVTLALVAGGYLLAALASVWTARKRQELWRQLQEDARYVEQSYQHAGICILAQPTLCSYL